ncbi:MAG: polysaccharide biosynthesis protein [Gemmatimonadales bacterium]
MTSLWLALAHAIDQAASNRMRRRLVLGIVEVVFPLLSVTAAVTIVYGGHAAQRSPRLLFAALILTALKLGAGVLTGAFAGRWRFVGIREAATVGRSALIAGGAGLILLHWLQLADTSIRLVGADTSIYIVLSCGARLGSRWLHELARRAAAGSPASYRRAAIIGAGESGSAVIKNMLASPKLLMEPVAVVDDDVNKHRSRLQGVPVAGPVRDLPAIVSKYRADEIIIAIPSATREQIGRVVDMCAATKVPFRIAPDPEEILNGRGRGGIRVLRPSDLLGRPQVELDLEALQAELNGARVAITGAAGSIGSELTRQLARLQPAVLYLIDRNENDLYFLCDELDRRGVHAAHLEVIQDIREQRRMARILGELEPTHVFHAAAFKHVPLMEFHLVEAVENNILGTWATLEAARAAGAGKFVLISTDKAVRPTSVMGATKRFVELLVAEWTHETPTRSVIVRFGNVLGSNGSVVPLFERQIAEGGPVTVTSREATRYFMTTTEAAQLVLQAVAMRESVGKVAILDMGRPIRIWDLAEQLIRMSGLRPGIDIEIIETGLRPGEKVHEELWWETEDAMPSSHPFIMLATVGSAPKSVTTLIPLIRELVDRDEEVRLRQVLAEAVGLPDESGDAAPHGRTPGREPSRDSRQAAAGRPVAMP